MQQQIIIFMTVAALTILPCVGETAGISEKIAQPIEIAWPEWWSDLPPPGAATSSAPAVADASTLQRVSRPTAALLDMLTSWLVASFELPAANERPRVVLVPHVRLAALRYRGLVSDRSLLPPSDYGRAGPLGSMQSVYAVYDDEKRTIYLPEDWEGETPVGISVLVHELVHHLQNAGGLKYSCPQERERPAYDAQTRWLGLFGKNLNDELDIDPFDILVRTSCFN